MDSGSFSVIYLHRVMMSYSWIVRYCSTNLKTESKISSRSIRTHWKSFVLTIPQTVFLQEGKLSVNCKKSIRYTWDNFSFQNGFVMSQKMFSNQQYLFKVSNGNKNNRWKLLKVNNNNSRMTSMIKMVMSSKERRKWCLCCKL